MHALRCIPLASLPLAEELVVLRDLMISLPTHLQELTCFRALAQRESQSLPARKKAAEARLAAQLQREEELQLKYKQRTSDLADAKRALQLAVT